MGEDRKVKCECGCNNTLYLSNLDSPPDGPDLITIGSEENARKGFANFKGVVIERKRLLQLLEDKAE